MRPADGVDVVDPGPEARALRRGVREELGDHVHMMSAQRERGVQELPYFVDKQY